MRQGASRQQSHHGEVAIVAQWRVTGDLTPQDRAALAEAVAAAQARAGQG